MIEEKSFTKDWIESFDGKEGNRIDTNILEKMIYAFHLLESLVLNKLDFTFKGGTCLVLLLEDAKRFSIDIDIICKVDKKDLDEILDKVIDATKFKSYSHDERRSSKEGVPKAHYQFDFDSVIDSSSNGKILLDVLVDDHTYPTIIQKEINSDWLEVSDPISVNIPGVNSILGDKLTAFAPNTIGIPYFKEDGNPYRLQIIKQLFDISHLFDEIADFKEVTDSFKSYCTKEIEYKGGDESGYTLEGILEDIIETCLTISIRHQNKKDPRKSNFIQLKQGVSSLGNSYLAKGVFRYDEAVDASAKAAYLAAKILKGNTDEIESYDGQDLKNLSFEHDDYNDLKWMKKHPNPATFWYWSKTAELLSK